MTDHSTPATRAMAVSLLLLTGFSTTQASSPRTSVDVSLRHEALQLRTRLNHLATHDRTLTTVSNSTTGAYLQAVKKVIRQYRKQHPRSSARAAVALMSQSDGHVDLTTSGSNLDFLSDPTLFGPAHRTAITEGVPPRTYDVYSAPLTVPRPYRGQYQAAVAVYQIIGSG